jgi:hypothetical protein
MLVEDAMTTARLLRLQIRRGRGGRRIEGNCTYQNPFIELFLSPIFVLNY